MFHSNITIIIIINRHAREREREESCIIVPWLRANRNIARQRWFSSIWGESGALASVGVGRRWGGQMGLTMERRDYKGWENISHLNRISRNALGTTLWTRAQTGETAKWSVCICVWGRKGPDEGVAINYIKLSGDRRGKKMAIFTMTRAAIYAESGFTR